MLTAASIALFCAVVAAPELARLSAWRHQQSRDQLAEFVARRHAPVRHH